MDIKDLIKWFILCCHVSSRSKFKTNARSVVLCLFLFLRLSPRCEAMVILGNNASTNSVVNNVNNDTKYFNNLNYGRDIDNSFPLSTVLLHDSSLDRGLDMARTFGRPFKKMAAAIIPLAFQIGAASTWAVVAALVGVKTLLVALVILKLLLVAGAAKFGSLFLHKTEHQGWSSGHQKEIHLHIHNGGHGVAEQISEWNREGSVIASASAPNAVAVDPYSAGPQTIHTPFGNYVKVEPAAAARR